MLSELEIAVLVEKYRRERDRFEKMASIVSRHLREALRGRALANMVTFRSKAPESLKDKLWKKRVGFDLDDLSREFGPKLIDLAGVRVLLYKTEDVSEAVRAVEETFDVVTPRNYIDRNRRRMPLEREWTETDGYNARHRVVRLKAEALTADPTHENLSAVVCEVQVVTLTDHVWNELEHDIKYKIPNGKPSEVQLAQLKQLRGDLDKADTAIGELMTETARQWRTNLGEIESPDELRRVLESRFGRVLRGDFAKLHDLLERATKDTITPAVLDRLFPGVEVLATGARIVARAGGESPDDVSCMVGVLWERLGKEFLDIARTWPGRQSAVARLIAVLGQTGKNTNRGRGLAASRKSPKK